VSSLSLPSLPGTKKEVPVAPSLNVSLNPLRIDSRDPQMDLLSVTPRALFYLLQRKARFSTGPAPQTRRLRPVPAIGSFLLNCTCRSQLLRRPRLGPFKMDVAGNLLSPIRTIFYTLAPPTPPPGHPFFDRNHSLSI